MNGVSEDVVDSGEREYDDPGDCPCLLVGIGKNMI